MEVGLAAAAGVGKGTLFRRFGSRAGLMLVLLDEDEKAEQQAMMFGPPPLGPGAPALERLTSLVGERSGIDIQLSVRFPAALPAEQETAIYRIVQEALTNIVKHAKATSVSIIVMTAEDATRLVIEDDGAGFDPSGAGRDRLGLAGMRERLALLGGRLEVESSEGAGTTIVAEVPLREAGTREGTSP